MRVKYSASRGSICNSWYLSSTADMELGHILWPSDPVTRESSYPETQLTRWPCSIDLMNSKCRLMYRGVTKKYSQVKEFLIIIGKSKSSLHGLTSSDFSPTTDTWQWLLSFQHFKRTFCIWAFFRKPENVGSHTGSKWWPGDSVTRTWKMTQMTHWPGDPMTQFHVWSTDPLRYWTIDLPKIPEPRGQDCSPP